MRSLRAGLIESSRALPGNILCRRLLSESAGILRMMLLHRQAVLAMIGGRVGGIVTRADVPDLRKTKAGRALHGEEE
jgi:hypothetical protein